jgi:hypothetical protein
MDLKDISGKVIVAVAVVVLLVVAAVLALSLIENEPFMIYGKEFGFPTGKLAKENGELKNTNQGLLELASKFKSQRDAALAELETSKSTASALGLQLRQQAKQAESTWFPVDDIEFSLNKQYTAREAVHKVGRKWSAEGVELNLEAVEVSNKELVLATNLAPPANRLRLNAVEASWSIPMARWEYRLTLVELYYGGVKVRLDRRSMPTQR